MSQEIENQIVRMEFDNKSFERNAKESMSTLEKLKAALRFDKVDMTPLQEAFSKAEATATKAGFSIRDIWIKIASKIEDEVATKIVNSAKKMMNALSFEGINDGFKEYELKMGSIQTIMAGTGESLATVNKYLDELNTYSDKTIYSFADMTNNIGKFTNAGVKLDDAVNAIKGIANEAAVSGANANEASRAMYNFSQALSAGYVKLIDWKSIENANMATKEFKDTLLEMASVCGTVEKTSDGMYRILTTNANGSSMDEAVTGTKNFNDSLAYQWMTTEVLTKTLKLYATSVKDLNEEEKELYETELRNLGLDDEQIKRFEDLGVKATNAASEIKTFTMLVDTLKEAIGSGWAMSWQLMIGDFEQAKALWTDVGNTLSAVIDGISEARNNFLKQGLRSGWEKALAGGGLEDVIPDAEKFKGILLDLAHNQGILNDEEYEGIDSTEKFLKSLHDSQWATGNLLQEAVEDYTNILKSMSNEELADAGFDEYDLRKLERFGEELKNTTGYAEDLADSMNELGGRENVIQALKNVFGSLLNVLKPIRDSFNETFGTLDPDKLYDLTKRFRKFTEELIVSKDASNTLKTSFTLAFRGIKTVIDGVITAAKGMTKLVLPLLNLFDAIFGLVGKIIAQLSGSSSIIKASDKFSEFGDKISNKYLKTMQKLADLINKIADAIRGIPDSKGITKIRNAFIKTKKSIEGFKDAFLELPIVQEMIQDFNKTVEIIETKFKSVSKSVEKSLDKVKDKFKSVFNMNTLNKSLTFVYTNVKNLFSLIKKLSDRIKSFFSDLKSGKKITDSFKDNFGDIINKIKNLKDNIFDFFEKLYSNLDKTDIKDKMDNVAKAIHEFIANITPEQITMIAIAITFMAIAINLLRLSGALQDALKAFTGIGSAIKNVINSYVKKQKSVVVQIAESIVLVASALWVLSTVPENKMKVALDALKGITIAIGVLTVVLTACGIAMSKLGGGKSLVELAAGLVIVASSFMVAALSLKVLEKVDIKGVLPKLLALAGVMTALLILSGIVSNFNRFGKGSLTMLAISGALLLASESLLKIGQIPKGQLNEAMNAMLKMMLGLAAITFAAGQIGTFSAIGLIAIIFSINRMIPTLEKIITYDYTNIQNALDKNVDIMKKIGGVIVAIIAVGALAGNRLKGAGMAILSVSVALGSMVLITKLCGLLSYKELNKGKDFIFSMAIVIGALVLCASRASEADKKSSGFKGFTRVAFAMGGLLIIAKLASMMKTEDLIKGEIAMLGLAAIMSAMLYVAGRSKQSEGLMKTIATMIFGISLILGEIALLSMIPLDKMKPALLTVLGIIGGLSLLSLALSRMNSGEIKGAQVITKISSLLIGVLMIGVAGYFISELADKTPNNVVAAAGSLAGVLIATMGLVEVLNRLGNSKISGARFAVVVESLGMVLAIGVILSNVAGLMKKYDLKGSDMLHASGAIAITLIGLSVAMLALERFKGNRSLKNTFGVVVASVIALAGVAAAIGLLTKYGGNANNFIKTSIALAIGLIGICAPITILGVVGRLCKGLQLSNLKTVIGSAIAAVLAVGLAIGALSKFGNPDTVVTSANALAKGIIAICIPIAVLGAIGKFSSGINVASTAVIVGGAILSLAGVAYILYKFANSMDMNALGILNSSIPALIAVMGMVSLMMIAISLAGLTGPAGITGGIILVEALIGVGLVIEGVILLGEQLGNLGDKETTIMHGIDVLVAIIGKIGEMIGSFISGFGIGLTSGLSEIGDNLIAFSDKMIIFSQNMEQVSSESLETVAKLSSALLLLTGAELVNGLVNLSPTLKSLVGEFSFDQLGVAVAGFCEAIKDIPDDSVAKASILADVLSKIAPIGQLNIGDLISKMIFGEGSMEHFAEGIKAFGEALIPFCEAVRGVTDEDAEAAQKAANATEPMIQLAEQIPKTGGWAQEIMGESDLKAFGESIAAFATGLVTLSGTLKELEETDPDYATKIQNAADSVEPLVNLTNEIHRFGGVLATIIGDTSLDKFGETLPSFAENLKTFVGTIKEIIKKDKDYVTHIQDVTTAAGYLVDLSNGIEAIGGIFTKGENDLAKFGTNLSTFGTKLVEFSTETSGVDLERMNSMIVVIEDLITSANDAKDVAKDAYKNFKTSLKDLSDAPIAEISTSLDENRPGIVAGFKLLFDSVIIHITGRKALDQIEFKAYSSSLILNFQNGFVNGFKTFKEVFASSLNYIKQGLKAILSVKEFTDHGANIVIGLSKGIDNNAHVAIESARSLARSVNSTLKSALEINSPSKVTYEFGKFYDMGLSNGIRDYSSMAVTSTEDMNNEIIDSANSIISKIKDVIDGNIEAQPTIRPVLDTTDIAEKAKNIGKMFTASDLQLAYRASSFMDGAYNEKFYNANDGESGISGNKQINFTQNNYSPKSLDRYEIYRQTKNQISQLKGVL